MKNDEATVSAKKTAIVSARAGAVAALLVLAGLLPLPLGAAIDQGDAASSGTTVIIASDFPAVAIDSEDTLDAEDRLPVLAEDVPKQADAPTGSDAREIDVRPPETSPPDADVSSEGDSNLTRSLWPPKELGIADRVQDWLARANREFQSTIIRRLSTPSAVAGDGIARKIEDVKDEDAAAAAAGAQEALSTAHAKLAAEAEAQHQRELSDAAAKAAEQAKAREAEAARIDEERKAAEEKRRAEEQKRQAELRLAEEEKAAKQKAAEEAAAKEAAEKAAAAAKEREIAERQAAEAAAAKRAAEAKEAEAKQQALREAEAAKAAEEAKAAEAAKAAKEAKEAKEAEEARAAEEAKAAEAKRRADEEAARIAAAQEAEARAKIAAASEAAEKERAAQEIAKKDAEAKQALAPQALAPQTPAPTRQAMVEDEDKDETNVAAAPRAAEQPSVNGAQPARKVEGKSSGESEAKAAARKPRHHARVHRQASNRSANRSVNRSGNAGASQSAHKGGPVVKRWVRRPRQGRCRLAGHKVLLPGRYTVARGDNLWLIALRHYHDGWYFRRIYRANQDVIRNPNLIYPCERLYLPSR
ncbi:LysM peptidoglycan-binding domain-containing protein [Hyphomicrobium facile]|uniref:LysM domain-containing protein n=1 Tax=Hyphomicrobium facile TaxID=51670 RepID=A0A1I7N3Z0_9HYPH|nr:LysM peptidoglycan-binding domain-containing protein [Hyphomicrobium facile]SFV29303.1 LysM domain-containing protein [Hyphomicrobium facile]